MIVFGEERKLDCLKMNPRGATNEAPTCAVNACPTGELLLTRGGGGDQRGRSGVSKEGTTKTIVNVCQGVGGW